jgi:negative regulator of sigma E activity
MNCDQVSLLIPEFIDGTLDSTTKEAVDRHLLTCPECSLEVSEMKILFAAMENSRPVRPSVALREQFQAMLHAEEKAVEAAKRQQDAKQGKLVSMQWFSALGKVGVAAAILLIGIGIGYSISQKSGTANSKEIGELKTSIRDVKETLMLNMLNNESASDRIKAVSYTEDLSSPNQRVIDALENTLNNDKNVNVRLAALYSLAKYSDYPSVSDSLVASLSRQKEPLIQIVLINLLGEKKNTKAIRPIQQILQDQKTIPAVKDIARKELNKL